MRAFRFRAQPALDLRCREHDAAQRALARADAERQRARERVAAAEARVRAAQHEADAAGSGTDREWYRFWIVRLEQERAACRLDLERREADVAAARAAWLLARQRRESLERLKEKSYRAHLAAEDLRERRMIDELAARRFATRRDGPSGPPGT
jgi:flagellar export protein FliJ